MSAGRLTSVCSRPCGNHTLPQQIDGISCTWMSGSVREGVTDSVSPKFDVSSMVFADNKVVSVLPTTGSIMPRNWHNVGRRQSGPFCRSFRGLHVIMGPNPSAVTSFVTVTCSASHSSPYHGTKSNVAHDGVCAEEYQGMWCLGSKR